ncbi:hypothetical protein J3R74_004090 [Puniceicoccus vermicola]|uniref:Uncharacterized protein n=1 Tax=Puniceicoccus vermicola TaxID=388746 RepID=A0A7X1AXR8_9BACT|nr:hypothetical protein [Puniceicoccus vermicola]MBC2601902.1 hypothetical protein [Puniceicoccus vermicola]
MNSQPRLNPSHSNENPATREQVSEILRHRLVPADRARLLSQEQAENLIRRHRRGSVGARLIQTVVWIFLLAALGAIGFYLYQTKLGGPVEYSISTGEWNRYIQPGQQVLILDELPSDLRSGLERQNELLSRIINNNGKDGKDSPAEKLQELKSDFPPSHDVQVNYRYDRSSSDPTNYSDIRSKGVQDYYVRKYKARFNQLKLALLPEQLPPLEDTLKRDISDLAERISKQNNSGLSAQNQATLAWLQSRLLPYLEEFESLSESSGVEKPLDSWRAFASSELPDLYSKIHALTTDKITVPPNSTIQAPRSCELLFAATMGSQELIILPALPCEVQIARKK